MLPLTRVPCWVPFFDPQPFEFWGRLDMTGNLNMFSSVSEWATGKTISALLGQVCCVKGKRVGTPARLSRTPG